jgi:hypothetical protein
MSISHEKKSNSSLRHFLPGLRPARSRRRQRSGEPLRPVLDTVWMTARSIACSRVMAGAN